MKEKIVAMVMNGAGTRDTGGREEVGEQSEAKESKIFLLVF